LTTSAAGPARPDRPARQAFWILRAALVVLPCIAGVDKLLLFPAE